jgi:hypothetical protein
MNGLKCPKCELVNLLSAKTCHRCGLSLEGLFESAAVSVPVDQTFQAQSSMHKSDWGTVVDTEIGRKTFFWYRIYCAVMLLVYLAGAGLGVFIVMFSGEAGSAGEQEEAFIIGMVYLIIAPIFALIYVVALLLPRKPFNWIVGIIMIAIGMTSCCFLPATIPLLIYWLKPETKTHFGRT